MASNNLLAILLVIVLVVAVVGTMISINKIGTLTGYGTEGEVNVTILNQTTINVTATQCNFGAGYVTAPYSYAVLNPGNKTVGSGCQSDSDTKDNWTNTTGYDPDCMEVRNDGNVRLFINVSSGKNATTFIGGNNPNVTMWSENKEADSCAPGGSVALVSYPGVEMDTGNKTACSCLYPENTRDEIYVGCRVTIPDNAYGTKGDIWTFWASASVNVPDCGSY